MLNLQLCAAVLFSGNNPTVSPRMLAFMGVQVVSRRTFFFLHFNVYTSGLQSVKQARLRLYLFIFTSACCAKNIFKVYEVEQEVLLTDADCQQYFRTAGQASQ